MALEGGPAHVRAWIEISESGATLVIRVGGELDASNRADIEPAVLAAIASAQSVIIDLAELTFCDSRGIGMFIAAHEKARAEGTAISFRHVVGPVRRVFDITRLDTIVDVLD